MKRIAGFVAGCLVLSSAAWAAESSGLYETYSRRGEVPVHVKAPADGSSGQSRVDAAVLKRQMEEALAARKSVKFRVVASAQEAELVVDTRIDGYLRTDQDPVDMLVGTAAIAMDAARQEPYVRVDATATVSSADGKVLWREKLTASVTGPEAAEATAAEAVGRKYAAEFVSHCFGKKRPR